MRFVADSKVQRFEKETVVHLEPLFGKALKMTRSQTEAEDLVQQTYLSAVEFFDRFQKVTNCKSWLFRGRRKVQKRLRDWAMANGYVLEGHANESA